MPVTRDREVINAPDAPGAVGAYSHAVRAQGFLFCSGQIPLDPTSGELVGVTPGEQAQQCLENLERVVVAGGARLADATRVTIYLTDMDHFAEVNGVYSECFSSEPPARVTIAVAGLPKGALVEIDAVIAVA